MKRLSLATALIFAAGMAQAAQYCLLDGTEVFSCTFNGGAKAVELCDAIWEDGDMVSYGFFKSNGEVEKEILQEKVTLSYTPWNGMGTYMSDSVTLSADGGYAYEVWAGGEQSAEAALEGGINVLQNDDVIATLSCDAGSVTSDLGALIEMIDLAQVSP
ncbi:hypothetical protein HCZ23_10950 [Celeribacter sp. HF31]|uniref:hypothetical protein n=1 Tax=Celeribacter sp. HF31 TaxID=2721558 RepID=UPI001430B298|nr:hypothetical protein [Celeribacter sp. HF31]NIY79982.1 hypothetical protein [Celeribacter sp. HF31]